MKCFVDSNVFISLIQNEFGKGMEFMSYRTKDFFEKVIECQHTIVISRAVLMEISKVTLLEIEEIEEWFEGFEDKIKKEEIEKKDIELAEKTDKERGFGKMDALHLIIAKKTRCDCIVTWNKKHFLFAKKIKILDPGQL